MRLRADGKKPTSSQAHKPSSTATQEESPQAKGGPARFIPKFTSSRILEPG